MGPVIVPGKMGGECPNRITRDYRTGRIKFPKCHNNKERVAMARDVCLLVLSLAKGSFCLVFCIWTGGMSRASTVGM